MTKSQLLAVGSTAELEGLSVEHKKALRHIISNGDDRALGQKSWKQIKIDLYRLGLLRRRIGDWAWVPTEKALRMPSNAPDQLRE